jgi:GT2 family glycosyltransferase
MIHIIIPTYGQLDTFRACIYSLLDTTPADQFFVTWLDDGSPDLTEEFIDEIISLAPNNIQYETFNHTGDLTMLWNYGLAQSQEFIDCEFEDGENPDAYVAIVNSDILFTPNWYIPLIKAAQQYDLVAPITNASGSYDQQRVTTYLPDYVLSDRDQDTHATAKTVSEQFAGQTVEGRIGGYFLFARWDKWCKHAYNYNHFFDPSFKLVGNEDEYQTRLLANGGTIATCLDSFIFHYRSLSRDLNTINPNLLTGMYRSEFQQAKIAYYTCVTTDNYDTPEPLPDYPQITPHYYHVDTVKKQRLMKIQACSQFKYDYEYSIWCDGNITPIGNPAPLLQRFLNGVDIAFFPHPSRVCVYQEARAVKAMKLDENECVNEQMGRYTKEGMPVAFGLPETGVILRRHTPAVQAFEELWAAELMRGSHRDQLSVSYALWKTGLIAMWLPENLRKTPYFQLRNHAKLRLPIIWGN